MNKPFLIYKMLLGLSLAALVTALRCWYWVTGLKQVHFWLRFSCC